MHILSAQDIRNWDEYTIRHEPIASIELMERAASECVEWLQLHQFTGRHFHIYCGKGNNGGDGLAMARMLAMNGEQVTVHILEFGHIGTDDFQANLARLHQHRVEIKFIQDVSHISVPSSDEIIIDALFGTGLNRGLSDVTAELVTRLNESGAIIISIDIPTGLFADSTSKGQVVIEADHTLSFQCLKLAMLLPENSQYTGRIHILDIGLHPAYLSNIQPQFEWIDCNQVRSLYRPRTRFSHKGTMGHVLLAAGSYGKMGAAVIAATGCMRAGAGLLTCHVPGCGLQVLQTTLPEAMVMTDFNSSYLTKIETDYSRYDAVGVGPGIGTAQETRALLRDLLDAWRGPLVLDADALNSIALQPELLQMLPAGTILTPHPREFERLFGPSTDDFARIRLALAQAASLRVVIVLKGHHTFIATPDGKGFFNSTGNPGMATAGSGDLLTGILTGLLAQGYSPVEAAILGVYLHGQAGDLAADKLSPEAMLATDIADQLGAAFKRLVVNI